MMDRPKVNIGPLGLGPFKHFYSGEPARSVVEVLDKVLGFYRAVVDGLLSGEEHITGLDDERLAGIARLLSGHVSDAADLRETIANTPLPAEYHSAVIDEVAQGYISGIIVGVLGARVKIDPLMLDASLGAATREQRAEFGSKRWKAAGRSEEWARWREAADEIRAEYAPKVARGWPKLSTLEVARRVKERLQLTEQVDSIRKRIAPSK